MYGVQCYTEPLAQVVYELLVAVALLAAQVEIAVDCLAIVAQSVKHDKEGDGIGSAAQSNKHLFAWFKQFVLLDESLNLVSHCAILCEDRA